MRSGLVCLLLSLAIAPLGTESFGQTTTDASKFQSPQDGGPRRWEVTADNVEIFAEPSSDAAATGLLAKRSVLSNLGCSSNGEDVWCKVRPFRGGQQGFVVGTHLKPATGPGGAIAMGVDDSKSRARAGDFDAKADIRCAQEQGQSLGSCDAAAAISGGGDATVVVTFPIGFKRSLFFVHGEFLKASATMSGVGTDTDWSLASGLFSIRVDDQKFEVPDTLVLGE